MSPRVLDGVCAELRCSGETSRVHNMRSVRGTTHEERLVTMKPTTIMFMAAAWQLVGCTVGEEYTATNQGPTWEEFRATVYQEDFEGGHFIVNGDIAIADEKQLYEFWESLQQGGLIVNRVGGSDDRWNDTAKLNLTYCISDTFGANKAKMVTAMNSAAAKWESLGSVNFTHLPAHDASCTASNSNVVFDVRPVSGQQYLARAFFPSSPRSSRNVLVDSSAFGNTGWPLANVVGHELGHTLGFRHEQTRPEAGTCFEDNNWRALTPYDSASIMHYPQCNGTSNDLSWTTRDGEGIAALYGAPGGQPPPPPPPGTEKTDTKTGSVAYRQMVQVSSYAVKVGTTFTVTMTGSGDPDLYVRWNNAPTVSYFHCRPYIDGPNEQCSLSVPNGATRGYVAVRGYQAGSYNLSIKYTSP